jgi:hypothetical protein
MREGTTSRVMATDRPYGEFYDFYSVSSEYFEYYFVYISDKNGKDLCLSVATVDTRTRHVVTLHVAFPTWSVCYLHHLKQYVAVVAFVKKKDQGIMHCAVGIYCFYFFKFRTA